jgi:hypothetical protein
VIVLESDDNSKTNGNQHKSYANSVRGNNQGYSTNTLSTVTSHSKLDAEKLVNMEEKVTEFQTKFEQKMLAIERTTSVLIEKRINIAVQSINIEMDNKLEQNNKKLNIDIEDKLKTVTKESNAMLLAEFKILLGGGSSQTNRQNENELTEMRECNNGYKTPSPTLTERISNKYQKISARMLPTNNEINMHECVLTTIDDCNMAETNENGIYDYISSQTTVNTPICR